MLSLIGLLFGFTLVRINFIEKIIYINFLSLKFFGICFGVYLSKEIRIAKEYIRKFSGNKRTPY